ncbi:MAG: replication restart DNA helicase PriA [Cyanobacteria bacterium J06621_11]
MSTSLSTFANPNQPTEALSLSVGRLVPVTQTVRCPTCGSLAERRLLSDRKTPSGEYSIQTACHACDYFMVMGSLTGRVIEAYAC